MPGTKGCGTGSFDVVANMCETPATTCFRRSAASSHCLRMGRWPGMRCCCVSTVYEIFGGASSSIAGFTVNVACATSSGTGFVGCGIEKITRNSDAYPCL